MKIVNNDKLHKMVESVGMPNMEYAVKNTEIPVRAEVPVTMAAAYKESEANKKHYEDMMKEKEDEAEEIFHKPLKNDDLEQNFKIELDESLFLEGNEELLPDKTEQKPGFEEWEEKYAEQFLGGQIARMDEADGNDLFMVIHKDLEFNPDGRTGKSGPHGGYHSTVADDSFGSHAINAFTKGFDSGISVLGTDAAQLNNAKRIANKYKDFGVFYEMEDYKGKGTGYYTKILYIYIPEPYDGKIPKLKECWQKRRWMHESVSGARDELKAKEEIDNLVGYEWDSWYEEIFLNNVAADLKTRYNIEFVAGDAFEDKLTGSEGTCKVAPYKVEEMAKKFIDSSTDVDIAIASTSDWLDSYYKNAQKKR